MDPGLDPILEKNPNPEPYLTDPDQSLVKQPVKLLFLSIKIVRIARFDPNPTLFAQNTRIQIRPKQPDPDPQVCSKAPAHRIPSRNLIIKTLWPGGYVFR